MLVYDTLRNLMTLETKAFKLGSAKLRRNCAATETVKCVEVKTNFRKIGHNDEKGLDKLIHKMTFLVIFVEVIDAVW